ncbi:MAG: hypothetical protein EZS28_029492 [Streblomastix strix]|uniref:Ig-like domain-containing protein n=1 Tax=Streblomastix strix TaxID=222440 RepID=A0A5J4UY06_9EUKA|nr:MAG: hypothetical protein EZS28_029492 [Streblomastix strix]
MSLFGFLASPLLFKTCYLGRSNGPHNRALAPPWVWKGNRAGRGKARDSNRDTQLSPPKGDNVGISLQITFNCTVLGIVDYKIPCFDQFWLQSAAAPRPIRSLGNLQVQNSLARSLTCTIKCPPSPSIKMAWA